MSTTMEEFKGNKILVLNADSAWPFKFGLSKAKAIIENFEEIKGFVAENSKEEKLPDNFIEEGE